MAAKKGLDSIVGDASKRPRPDNYPPAPDKPDPAKRRPARTKQVAQQSKTSPDPAAQDLRLTTFNLSEGHRSTLDAHARRLGTGRVEIVRALINLLEADAGPLTKGVTDQVESGSVTLLRGAAAYKAALNNLAT